MRDITSMDRIKCCHILPLYTAKMHTLKKCGRHSGMANLQTSKILFNSIGTHHRGEQVTKF